MRRDSMNKPEKKRKIYLVLGKVIYGLALPGFVWLLVAWLASGKIGREFKPYISENFYFPVCIWATALISLIIIRTILKRQLTDTL